MGNPVTYLNYASAHHATLKNVIMKSSSSYCVRVAKTCNIEYCITSEESDEYHTGCDIKLGV